MCKTYYVSSINGKKENSGLSEQEPYADLSAVNALDLQPGDQVLLERGSVFQDAFLKFSCRGSAEAPIVVDAYGEGKNPVIHANGTGIWYQDYGTKLDAPTHVYRGEVSSAVLLYDADEIVVRNLEITNRDIKADEQTYSAPHKMNRTGVAVVAKDGGTLRGIVLEDLYIHDVHGNVYDKHMNNGGIYATALKPADEAKTGVARYDGLIIRRCLVMHVSRWGIAAGYTYCHEQFKETELDDCLFMKYGHENMKMSENFVKEVGGDAITTMYALRPLVEHNFADAAGREMNDRVYKYPEDRMGKVAAAIWPWKCKDALFRYNEAVNTRLNQDSQGYDADSGDGTVYELNYSRLNEGGCVMFCLEQAVHNTFRNNISVDDLGGTISPVGNPDALIENNMFYVRQGVPFLRNQMSDGEYTLKDNHIIQLD